MPRVMTDHCRLHPFHIESLFSIFRNQPPTLPSGLGHSRSDALDMLTLASRLQRRLDEADIRHMLP